MRLGGIDIDCDAHLVGHSDADLLLHAITDALLGAANLGDIGQMFPNTDPANRGRDSADMLRLAWEKVRQAGFRLVNLDCVVQTEIPKLSPVRGTLIASIAEILQVDPAAIGLKGKTGEGSGPIGHKELAEATVVALLAQTGNSALANQPSLAVSTDPKPIAPSVPSPSPRHAPPPREPDMTEALHDSSRLAPNLRVYNTLTKTKEPLMTQQPGAVGMYLCGPTVYAPAHIGHMVGPVIFDTIKRYLVYCGYSVTWVVNITDIDDKLIQRSNQLGISMPQLATQMTADYLSNLQALGVDQIDHLPRATDHIPEIIQFVQELIDRGYAYASEGDVFFDVARDSQYGQLSNRSADSQQGEGGEAASRKRSPGDFALWKKAKAGEPSWESPWGAGRPGWHIECSAMSRRILGKTFDIHGGGLDLVFPHHENESAQSRCCHGAPMVRYWMHNGLMRASEAAGKVGGRSDREATPADTSSKISRSKGAGGLAKLIEQQTGERLRFFLLRTQYRSTNVFGEEPLQEAGTALETFYRLFQRYERLLGQSPFDIDPNRRRASFVAPPLQHPVVDQVLAMRESFLTKMDDDFNTGGAVSDLFDLARSLNRFIESAKLEESQHRTPEALEVLRVGMAILRELSAILGLFQKPVQTQSSQGDDAQLVDDLMKILLQIRAQARQNKDFATADLVRNGLTALKIAVQDLKEGSTWSRQGPCQKLLAAFWVSTPVWGSPATQ